MSVSLRVRVCVCVFVICVSVFSEARMACYVINKLSLNIVAHVRMKSQYILSVTIKHCRCS